MQIIYEECSIATFSPDSEEGQHLNHMLKFLYSSSVVLRSFCQHCTADSALTGLRVCWSRGCWSPGVACQQFKNWPDDTRSLEFHSFWINVSSISVNYLGRNLGQLSMNSASQKKKTDQWFQWFRRLTRQGKPGMKNEAFRWNRLWCLESNLQVDTKELKGKPWETTTGRLGKVGRWAFGPLVVAMYEFGNE